MITEDYVSFETAKLLKKKGFVIDCLRILVSSDNDHFVSGKSGYDFLLQVGHEVYPAPTLQMAMKWLREVYKLHISVEIGFDVDNHQHFFFSPGICKFSHKVGEYQTPFGEIEFASYEEACEAAIKYCLENLI